MHPATRRPPRAPNRSTFPSPARLAAEALFADSPPATPGPVPIVVVKKRSPVRQGAAGAAMPEPPAAAAAATPLAQTPALVVERTPRVFTLRLARPAAGEPQATAADARAAAETPALEPTDGPRRTRRTERIGHDTRARVIRHVTVVPEPASDGPTGPDAGLPGNPQAAAAVEPMAEADSPAALLRRLARLDAVFDEIRRAHDFTVVDAACVRTWARLSARGEQLSRALKALQS